MLKCQIEHVEVYPSTGGVLMPSSRANEGAHSVTVSNKRFHLPKSKDYKVMNERSETGWRTDHHLRRTRTIVLSTGDPEEKRSQIRQYFYDTYDIDESPLEILRYDKTFYRRADPLRHPLIFYFDHTATFYIDKLILPKLIQKRFNPTYESMFAVGVDEMSWDGLDEQHCDWPPVAEVQAYRDRVCTVVDHLIQIMPLQLPIA